MPALLSESLLLVVNEEQSDQNGERKGFSSLAEVTSTDTLESLCLRNGEEANTLPSTGKPGKKS